jgi:hypothetical protein
VDFKIGDKVKLKKSYGNHNIGTEGIINSFNHACEPPDLIIKISNEEIYIMNTFINDTIEKINNDRPMPNSLNIWYSQIKRYLPQKDNI